jgi:intein-encoded DNA endonuclease-like protein
MAADLLRLGCMPNKTWKIRFPNEDILPTEFIADFCRGFWDGDGHVSRDEKTLAVISNKFFILEMLTKLPVKNPRLYYKQSTKFTDDPDKQTILCYVGMKHGVKQLIQFLYGDCENNLYLPRKRAKALHWLNQL